MTTPTTTDCIPETTFSELKKRMTQLSGIVVNLNSTVDFNEVLSLAVERITTVVGAKRASLFLVEEDNSLVSRVVQGTEVEEIKMDPGKGLVGWTARHGVPLLVQDAYADERFDPDVDQKSGFTTRDVMCHPIWGRSSQVIGVVETLGSIGGLFNESDLVMLGAVCSQLSMIIENSRIIVDLADKNRAITEAKLSLEKRNEELQILLELERILVRSESVEDLGTNAFEKTLKMIGASEGSLYLVDKNDIIKRIYSAEKGQVGYHRVESGTGFTGWVAARHQELNLKEPQADPRFEQNIHTRTGVAVKNLIACPLPFPEDSTNVGAVMVCNKKGQREFTDNDMMILRLVASQVAAGIERLLDREEREKDHRLATVGRLLAGVLHDLKTPITSIWGYAELMAESTSKAESQDYLSHIRTALHRIKSMTADIVSFSKGESSLIKSTLLLDELIDEYKSHMSNYLTSHNVELVIRKRTGGAIKVDREKLLRAFHNITINGAEAMPDGGKIIFEVDRLEKRLIFSFTDAGHGIAQEVQGNLFNSFVSFGKHEGTGLGLAVAREIVEGHGGTISFTTFPRVGTTFLVTIPAE